MTTITVGPQREIKTPFHAALAVQQSLSTDPFTVNVEPAVYDQPIYSDNKGNTSFVPLTGYAATASAGCFGTSKSNVKLVGGPGVILKAAYLQGATYPLSLPNYWPVGNHRPFNGIYGKGIVVMTGDNCTVEGIEGSGFRNGSGNGAGLRFQGGNWTSRDNYFHDNEMNFQSSTQPLFVNGVRTFGISENDRSSGGGSRDVNQNWGQSHNAYWHEAGELFIKNFTSWDVGGAGLLLKVISGGGRKYIINPKLSEKDGGAGSYEGDFDSGPCILAGGHIVKGIGMSLQNTGKMNYYYTSRTLSAEDGNCFYAFGNMFQCYLQKQVHSIDLRNMDGPDPDTLTEYVSGDIFKNVVVYRPNTSSPHYDAGFKPYALPTDPKCTVKVHNDNVKVREGQPVPDLLTPAQRGVLAALTFDHLDAFYEDVKAGAFA